MSSFLPDLIVAQAVDKLHLKSPIDRKTLNDMVQAGLERLYSYQHDDGGWGWWPDDPSRVFMTAYVVSGLGQAKTAGYTVDDDRVNNGTKLAGRNAGRASRHDSRPARLRGLRAGHHRRRAKGRARQSMGQPRQAERRRAGAGWAGARCRGRQPRASRLRSFSKRRPKPPTSMPTGKATTTACWTSGTTPRRRPRPSRSSCSSRQDRSSGLMPKAARWLAEHRDGDYWYSTKQTSMVIQGLTDYLALSGELANTSDVEVLVNGASVGKRHFGPDDAFAAPWQIKVPAAQAAQRRPGDDPQERQRHHLLVRREQHGTPPTASSSSRASSRSTSRAITTCSRRSRTSPPIPSPTTWFRSKARCMWATSWPCGWR